MRVYNVIQFIPLHADSDRFAATASPAKAPINCHEEEKEKKKGLSSSGVCLHCCVPFRRVLEMAYSHIRLSPMFLGFINQSSPKEKIKKVIKYNRGSHLTEKVISCN
jgi:hypothetical protein